MRALSLVVFVAVSVVVVGAQEPGGRGGGAGVSPPTLTDLAAQVDALATARAADQKTIAELRAQLATLQRTVPPVPLREQRAQARRALADLCTARGLALEAVEIQVQPTASLTVRCKP